MTPSDPDPLPPDPHPNRAESALPPRPIARNLSLLRLEEADRRVRRRLVAVRGRLTAAGVETRVAEGSAIAAEILLADDNVRRRAIRVNLLLREPALERAVEALTARGYRRLPATRSGASATVELLKRAARDRRGAVHVVFDEELAPAGRLRSAPTGGVPRVHPGSEEAVRDRARRLARYRLEPAVSIERRWVHEAIRGRLEEILEVGLVFDRVGST